MAKGQIKQKQDLIRQNEFEELCHIQCTQDEICSVFGIDSNTLSDWVKRTYNGKTFQTVAKEKRAGGHASLRRMQYKTAERGNVTMQIWLGKQYLGQTDKVEQENTERIEIINDYKPD